MFDPVYMAWDLYDGPRTGIASFQGSSHYFSCPMTAEGTSTHSTTRWRPLLHGRVSGIAGPGSAACRYAARLQSAVAQDVARATTGGGSARCR